MGQRSKGAAVKDVQIKLGKEECVGGTGRIEKHKMNLLHLDQNLNSLLQLKAGAIIIEHPELPSEDRKESTFLGR